MVLNPLTAIIAGAGGGLAAGAGGAVVNLALISYSAANTFINSYYFGYGMILGERDMYQNDWPKIQDRLEKGETFLRILEEKMREKTAAIMSLAGDIQLTVDTNYSAIMLQRLLEKPGEAFVAILNYLGLKFDDEGAVTEGNFIDENIPQPGGGSKKPTPSGTGKGIPDILGGDPETPVPIPKPGGKAGVFTQQQLNKNNPTWKSAIALFTNKITQYQKAIDSINAYLTSTAGKKATASTRQSFINQRNNSRKLQLALSNQLAAFVSKYPSSSTNYP